MLLKELRYILAIHECGTVSKAAEKLYISQPALSKYIRNLETVMDTKLFTISGRKIILTDAGTRYVEAARAMLDIYESMSRNIQASDNMICGTLRVGVSFTRSPFLLSETIPIFHRMYPNVEIRIFEENSYELGHKLEEGIVDVLIIKGSIPNANKFTFLPLFEEELLFAIPPGHPMAEKGAPCGKPPFPWVDLSQFSNELFILLKLGQGTRMMADELFLQYNFQPEQTLITSNIETAFRMVSNGMGVTFVPSFFTSSEYIQDLDIRLFSIGPKMSPHIFTTFNIIYRQEAHLTKYSKAFIQLMQDHFSNFEN